MLTPVLSVTTPATDLTLLTIDELRAIVGANDKSRDADLKRLGDRAADAIVQACKLPADGATPPTLRQEVLVDTFRLNRWWGKREHIGYLEDLVLSRRPIVSVASITETGVTLDPTSDYEIHAAAGTLTRLFNDQTSRWAASTIIVTYTAGWAVVPQGLKRAAEKLIRLYSANESRDPLLRSEEVTGISSRTFWIGAPGDPSIPQDVMDDLGPYINPVV